LDLDKVEDPGRREQLSRIIRGLARPNIIEFDEEKIFHQVEIAVPCPPGGFEPAPADTSGPYITVEPSCAEPGDEVTVRGFGFQSGIRAPLSFIPPTEGVVLKRADVEADDTGNFEMVIELPDRPLDEVQHLRVTTVDRHGGWAWGTAFTWLIWLVPLLGLGWLLLRWLFKARDDPTPTPRDQLLRPLGWISLGLLALFAILLVLTFLLETGGWTWSANARLTGEKIVETVMLALMATTLGIAVGVPLSFFSARNLMRNIRSPMISVGLFLVGIPAGIVAGTMWGRFATEKIFTIGSDAFEVGLNGESMFLDQPINAAAGLVVVLALGWLLIRWLISVGDDPDPTTVDKVQRGFGWLGFVLLLLESVLVSGYLLMWLGEHLQEWMAGLPVLKSFDFLAGFLVKLGDVFTTFFTAMTAILAALAGALSFSRLGHALNDHLPRTMTSFLRYPSGFAGIAVISIGIGGMVNYLYRYDWNNPAIPATAGALMLAVAGGILFARAARPLRDSSGT